VWHGTLHGPAILTLASNVQLAKLRSPSGVSSQGGPGALPQLISRSSALMRTSSTEGRSYTRLTSLCLGLVMVHSTPVLLSCLLSGVHSSMAAAHLHPAGTHRTAPPHRLPAKPQHYALARNTANAETRISW